MKEQKVFITHHEKDLFLNRAFSNLSAASAYCQRISSYNPEVSLTDCYIIETTLNIPDVQSPLYEWNGEAFEA